jgi:hypothetical protein
LLLVDVVVWLALLGTVMIVATPVFRTSFRMLSRIEMRHRAQVQQDMAMDILRRDVCAAEKIELNGDHLTLVDADGRQVLWTADQATESLLRRRSDQPQPVQAWKYCGTVTFLAGSNVLEVTMDVPGVAGQERFTLATAGILLKGTAP